MTFEAVRKNKVKTFFIVMFFFMFIAVFIYFLSLWIFEDAYVASILCLIVSIILSFVSYYSSDKIVLKLNGARKASKEEFLELNLILEGLVIATGIPSPELYVIDSDALNAFATGRNPNNSVICVTTGLIGILSKYEMEGVLAHELSHIKNYDILLQTVAIVMVGFVSILANLFSRGFLVNNSRNDDKNENAIRGILMIVGLIFIVLSPIFAKLLQLSISRNREYLADACAVNITRNKDGLISALKKISEDTNVLTSANKTSESLYIVNPFNGKRKDSIYSTHPTVENRIERLRNIS